MGKVHDTITDAIAITAIDRNNIIFGKGNELHMYTLMHQESENLDIEIVKKPLDVKPFTNAIHGIELFLSPDNAVESDDLLLVYGCREFLLLSANRHSISKDIKFNQLHKAFLSDWIIGARILQTECTSEFVLLTAHSVILRFMRNEGSNYELLERISCSDKAILYTSKLSGRTWEELVVLSGNAFGELLIWQPSITDNEPYLGEEANVKIKHSPILKRMSVHKGPLFSIDFCEKYNILVSSGDDRATKWFEITLPESSYHPIWSNACIKPMVTVFGHGARVFKGSIIGNVKNSDCTSDDTNIKDEYYILSAGEDSCFCLWRSDGKLLLKRRQQHGAIIWNLTYIEETHTVFTVGSDGNLIAYDLSMALKEINLMPGQIGILIPPISPNDKEYMAKIRFLNTNGDILIGISNNSRILHLHRTNMSTTSKHAKMLAWEKSRSHWTPWNINIDFKCSVFEVSIELNYTIVALCGHHRLILLRSHIKPQVLHTIIYNDSLPCGLIRTFIFLSRDYYLVGDNCGKILILRNNCKIIEYLSNPTFSGVSCKKKESWPIAAILLRNNSGIDHTEHILISTRQGFLILYARADDKINNFSRKSCIKYPSGSFGATCIKLQYQDQNKAVLCAYGRNSSIIWYKVDLCNSIIQIINMERIPVCWTATVLNLNKEIKINDLIIGFNDNHLVVWSRFHDILSQIPCGGGYRSWHYCLFENEFNNIYLNVVYVKSKRLYVYQIPINNRPLIATTCMIKKWHTASCNAIESIDSTMIVTAGDDNLIKLCQLKDSSGEIQVRQDIHSHISNVKALKLLQLSTNSYILLSGGGRGQLCGSRITHCNEIYQVEHIFSHILIPLKTESDAEQYNRRTDVRIMSIDALTVIEGTDCFYKIYLGCSDGYIRHLHLHLNSTKLIQEEVIHINYRKCILHVRTIPILNCLATATTNGILRFYDLKDYREICELKREYQSAITALDLYYNKERSILQILCGGDDQSISYMECKRAYNVPEKNLVNSELNFFSQSNHFYQNHLHNSQVTGVKIDKNGLFGYTAGIDRTVYQLDLKMNGLVTKCFRSSIADIKGISLFLRSNQLYCLIFGNGLQIYSFSNSTNVNN